MVKKNLPAFITKKELIHNWLYKIVAFLVAFAIWATMLHGRKDSFLVRNMEIELITRSNYIVANEVNRNVQIKISGSRASLQKFSQQPPIVNLNLTSDGVGKKIIVLDEKRLSLPGSVKLLSVNPKNIEVDIKEVN